MEKLQAAYTILFALCSIDGDADEREIERIGIFLKENADDIDFDLEEVNKGLAAAARRSRDDYHAEISKAIGHFKEKSSKLERFAILEAALRLVLADKEVDENEAALIQRVAREWDINFDEFLDARTPSN